MGFIPDLTWTVCGRSAEVRDTAGLRILVDEVLPPLADFDMVVVPGGLGSRILTQDVEFVNWIRACGPLARKVSVCTGSLLLGAAGFLEGRRATTHPSAYDHLAPYCAEVVRDARIVDEGRVVTARGVIAAIDLGLHLCAQLAGADAAAKIRAQMDYPYR